VPRDVPLPPGLQQAFTRCEIGHPYVVAVGGQASSARAGREYAKSVFPPVDRSVDRFRSDHGPPLLSAHLDRARRCMS
jgi:hypothetical protein